MSWANLRAVVLASAAALMVATAAGCAVDNADAETEDPSEADLTSGQRRDFDDIIKSGGKIYAFSKADSRAELKGFIPKTTLKAVAQISADPNRWKESGMKGKVSDVKLRGDVSIAAEATWLATYAVPGRDVAMEMKLQTKAAKNEIAVDVTNTKREDVTLLGQFLEPGGIRLTYRLVPYKGGVIVLGTSTVELKLFRSLTEQGAGEIQTFFDFLRKQSR